MLQQPEKVMFRALITQKNPDGSIKEVNGVKQVGGVIEDRLGEALGYVFDESKYDRDYKRKPEHFVHNWYSSPKDGKANA
jgi:hypothetical protein